MNTEFKDLPYPDGAQAIMFARSLGIVVSKSDTEGNLALEKIKEVDEETVAQVKKRLAAVKPEVLGILNDPDGYQQHIEELRGQFAELQSIVQNLGEQVIRGMTVFHWIWKDAGCITGRKSGCFSPYIMLKCHACGMEDANENKEATTV